MTEILICLDSVWEHDPDRKQTRRLAGAPTETSPTDMWRPYLELVAGTAVTTPTATTTSPPEPNRPGRRILIRRHETWKGTTDSTALILTTDVVPAGRWQPGPTDRTVIGPDGQTLIVPHIHPTSAVGIVAILDVAEQLPDPALADVIADWYWPCSTVQGVPAIVDRGTGTPLIGSTDPETIRTVAALLARHPIPTHAHITSALHGAGEWDVGPTAIHHADDDVIAVQLERAGWSVDHLAAIGPRAHRDLLLEAHVIEQSGVPWPLVHKALRNSGA